MSPTSPTDEFHARGDLDVSVAVDLGLEAVQYHDLVATCHERANEVRADEARAASDKCLHVIPILG